MLTLEHIKNILVILAEDPLKYKTDIYKTQDGTILIKYRIKDSLPASITLVPKGLVMNIREVEILLLENITDKEYAELLLLVADINSNINQQLEQVVLDEFLFNVVADIE